MVVLHRDQREVYRPKLINLRRAGVVFVPQRSDLGVGLEVDKGAGTGVPGGNALRRPDGRVARATRQ
jgi:hypothetical protein